MTDCMGEPSSPLQHTQASVIDLGSSPKPFEQPTGSDSGETYVLEYIDVQALILYWGLILIKVVGCGSIDMLYMLLSQPVGSLSSQGTALWANS